MPPIRIFIGTEPKTRVADKVLTHSIRTNTDADVQITPMIGREWEYPLTGIKVGTGFSLRRWMIPLACDWKGRAIYMDADQLVFGDVKELYDRASAMFDANPEACVSGTWQPDKYFPTPALQTAVMVIDCARAESKWQFNIVKILEHLRAKTSRMDYARLMHGFGLQATDPLPVEWNHLNVYKEGKTKLLHYTKEPEQPWYKPDHPLAGLWKKALIDALEDGAVTRADMEDALSKWNVKEDWRNTNGLHPSYRKFLVSAIR